MTALSYLDKKEAKKLLNKDILCAQTVAGLGNFGVLIGFDDTKRKFKVKMTGGEGTSWYGSTRYYNYIKDEK